MSSSLFALNFGQAGQNPNFRGKLNRGRNRKYTIGFESIRNMPKSRRNEFRRLKAATMIWFWAALIVVFAPWSPAAATDIPAGKTQIQGGNLRVEFDNHLRSRVVACFDKKETVMGPFTASETVTAADKPWTGFLLTSQ